MAKKKKRRSSRKKNDAQPVAASGHSGPVAIDQTTDHSAARQPPVPALDAANSGGFKQYFSFLLLLIAIVLVGIMFYEVMAAFWVPIFLAAVLVVVFRPWYDWIRDRFKFRDSISALLTSISVLLIVLVPAGVLMVLAAAESQQVLRKVNSARALESINQVRSKLQLENPEAVVRTQADIQSLVGTSSLTRESRDFHKEKLFELEINAAELATIWGFPPPKFDVNLPVDTAAQPNDSTSQTPIESKPVAIAPWDRFLQQLTLVEQSHQNLEWILPDTSERETDDQKAAIAQQTRLQVAELNRYRLQLSELSDAFETIKIQQLGGKARAWVATMLTPSQQQYESYVQQATDFLRDKLVLFGGKGISFFLLTVAGVIVMIVAFHFFLLDGHTMLAGLKRLSPLDDDHEEELVAQFSRVSRAVVVATLLSALVQGILAGIGFYFVGLDSIFLLTLLSAVLAMVPFLGAASVWLPCALYLYFVENNLTTAIGLAIYGAAIVSMADNVIKPLVLHGHSKLHPLFAFLSVIGGVGALGPIGILIGPMIVAFLQTLLEILSDEMKSMA